MKGLYIKDLRLLMKQKAFLLVFIFLTIFNSFQLDNNAVVPSLMIFFLSTLAFTTVTYDEMDHGLTFLFTLPISRKKYVAGKYLLSTAIIVLAMLLSIGIVLVMNAIKNQVVNFELFSFTFGFVFLLGLLYMSLMLPIYFKFGAEKSRLILILVMGVIFFFVFAGSYLMQKINVDITVPLNTIMTQPLWLLTSISIVITAAAVVISYLLSAKIVKKKEL
ncbi:ABC-2 transporter permease [Enterococcus sp. AZ109]|uniref:ABC-2 transporter permease n=1 Tax=Enterococcus sp. AZ109 TaxID=2774634 RepID=UPI003F22D2B9